MSTRQFDAIVLGGGIAGLGVVQALVRRSKKVLVITPSKALAGEATPASAGIIDPFLESSDIRSPFFKLKEKSAGLLPRQIRRLEKETGIKSGYARTGMFFAATNETECQRLKQRWKRHQSSKTPPVWMNRTQALKHWPVLGPKVLGVLYYPAIARVFPARLQQILKKNVSRKNVIWKKASGTIRLLQSKGQVLGVLMNGRDYRAPHVVNAAGSWAGRVTPWPVPLFPVRGQVQVVRARQVALGSVAHSAGGIYAVPWEKGSFLLGSTVEKAGFKAKTDRRTLDKIQQRAAEILPLLQKSPVVQRWAGLRPCSRDHLPGLGKTPLKGYYMACGYYRSGIVIGMHAGELLVRGIYGKSFPREILPFSPMRWFKNKKA